MRKLELLGLQELSIKEKIQTNGGSVNEDSLGYRMGAAVANTVGQIIGCFKLLGDAFADSVKGKMFERIFR